ncbi:MAG TPA: hypothetical protein VGV38_07235 [Pyrinomonadaceae bacterium]|nr:hypothetical protein [Pyrinomonadaceae bacterium]
MTRGSIVLLGMMSKMPVAGVVWQTLHYLVGFERLGFESYYVEAHGITPTKQMTHAGDDASARAARFIERTLAPHGLGSRWAFHALHEREPRLFGMSEGELRRVYESAALVVNLHGGTVPRPEHYASGRLVFLETDPVELQIELHENRPRTIEFLEPHAAFFTFAENYGRPDCALPVSERFRFRPTRQPVVIDFWRPFSNGAGTHFTTVANWRQQWRDVTLGGEVYRWSKHHEFVKHLDLPRRTRQEFELALSNLDDASRATLEAHGWRVRPALDFSHDPEEYRRYVARSRGEWTVAKDQNVRLRTGWFSDRSATYLAAARPVVTQETGFSNHLPTGEGLFAFDTTDEAAAAVEEINRDHARHARAAARVAREHFSHEVVLGRLLSDVGL